MSGSASSNRTRFRPSVEPSAELLAQTKAAYTDQLVVDAFAILAGGGTVADAKAAVVAGRGDLDIP